MITGKVHVPCLTLAIETLFTGIAETLAIATEAGVGSSVALDMLALGEGPEFLAATEEASRDIAEAASLTRPVVKAATTAHKIVKGAIDIHEHYKQKHPNDHE